MYKNLSEKQRYKKTPTKSRGFSNYEKKHYESKACKYNKKTPALKAEALFT